ncbi:MAG: DUF3879 family protein [Lachnospiraceae bacterium]|nr:DUF3879 family protein [Lachnospiraceae bacterium]
MSKIMDYSFLFQQMFGTSSSSASTGIGGNMVKMSDLSSPAVQSQLKAAGIDTNSKQYQTVVKSMMTAGRGGGYFTIQGIKNRMQYYDADGDHINQAFGVSGLTVTDKNIGNKNRIVSVSDDIRNEMFELTKKEFLQENGVANGETTKRSDIYRKMYPQIAKKDRLAAGHTLSEYEKQYLQAFKDAVKATDPKWKEGKPIPAGVLDNITRERVEAALTQSNGKIVKRGVNMTV